jgi:hypothetical protein
MKRPSYREGVRWIAANDESTTESVEAFSAADTTRLLASLFKVDEKLTAIEILKRRR